MRGGTHGKDRSVHRVHVARALVDRGERAARSCFYIPPPLEEVQRAYEERQSVSVACLRAASAAVPDVRAPHDAGEAARGARPCSSPRHTSGKPVSMKKGAHAIDAAPPSRLPRPRAARLLRARGRRHVGALRVRARRLRRGERLTAGDEAREEEPEDDPRRHERGRPRGARRLRRGLDSQCWERGRARDERLLADRSASSARANVRTESGTTPSFTVAGCAASSASMSSTSSASGAPAGSIGARPRLARRAGAVRWLVELSRTPARRVPAPESCGRGGGAPWCRAAS